MPDGGEPSPLLLRVAELVERGDCPGAYQTLLSLLDAEPGNAVAWFNLGGLCERLRQWDSGVACFRRAVRLHPGFVRALMALGWHLHLAGRTVEAEGVLRDVIGLDGGLALAHTNLGHVLTCLDREEEGLREHLKAVDLDPTDSLVRLGAAFSLFFNERWLEGFAAFEVRIPIKMPNLLSYSVPRWDGRRIGRLFVQGEQGLGDTVMMLRYFAEVDRLSDEVLVSVQGPLVGLVRELWPSARWRVMGMPHVMPVEGVDAYVPAMSLPSVLGLPCPYWDGAYVPGYPTKFGQFTKKRLEAWFSERGAASNLRVGLAWRGDPTHDNDHHRSVALRELLRLTEVVGCEFVSLQYGGTKDIDSLACHALVEDCPQVQDMRDVAALVRGLDLVISVDTAVAHLGGAMGCPIWLLVNQMGCDWRWLRRGETTEWYPSVRIFRRALDEQWRDVVMRVAEELEEFAGSARSRGRDLAPERVLGVVG